jgi:hypothetical protein
MGLMEQLGRQARTAAVDTYKVAAVSPGATQPLMAIVTRAGGDTLLLVTDTPTARVGPWIMPVDLYGRLKSYSGTGTAFQAVAERVEAVDLVAADSAFARRPLGQLSVRDTARVDLAGAAVWVDYGRPLKRGREVFGSVVPWNTVWRTGANAATQFHAASDLVIGGAPVPAGTYTLWTLPTPTGWKLILNKQTGQWGTEYHAEQDLVRVDMRAEALPSTVEQFTIEFAPEGAGARMQLSWDRTRVSVPITRKP